MDNSDAKLAIHELIGKASSLVDAHDAAGFASTFTDDGVFDRNGERVQGQTAIEAFMAEHIAAGNEESACHLNFNFIVSVHGVDAHCVSRVIKLSYAPPVPVVIAVAIYTDELIQTSDGWRFKSRSLRLLYPGAG